MTAIVETLIFCDGRDEGLDCPMDGPYAEGDAKRESARTQRASYKLDGWRYVKGKDYCPDCVKSRKASTKATP